MKHRTSLWALAGAFLLAVSAGASAYDEQEVMRQIGELDWIAESGPQSIGAVNAVYDLRGNEAMIVGEQAKKFLALTQGEEGWDDTSFLTYTISGQQQDSFVVYAHQPIGYVSDEDWADIDPVGLISELRKGQKESNEQRAAAGYPTLEIVGWAEQPTYDVESDVAYWAVRVKDSMGAGSINATALKLSRDGFTRITWVGSPDQFQDAQATLVAASESYRFREGAKYADFVQGDAVAGVGLAALATGIVTGKGWTKTAGAGVLAIILAFAKKLWFLLLIPFLWIGKLFRQT